MRVGIIEAATSVFSESGFRGATMKDVAERAGISQRGLVHHFKSKDELLLEVLEYRDRKTALLLPLEGKGGEIKGLLQVVRDNARVPELIELRTIISAEATSPDHPAHAHYAKRYADFRRYIAETFESIKSAGELESPLDPIVLAEIFIGLIDGVQLQWLYDRSIDVEAAVLGFLATVCPATVEREAEQPAEQTMLSQPSA
ncbi:TetR/AcrR family transcriptional regulator [Arthrobacter sp. efr-133-TYG-118]|uniref:TetR/AcrR family transcriptional regulator n=1 Tax=Arthrobacter sp. efr-133-TYG-118 TaxID=3040279 RepID=UPI00254D39CA|nr:TetR/AcrR family transcriptional regulator [Arthrobacter sp. efr-133-TYG-118]